ncbi:MAG TPA: hypothetical protein VI136_05005, partial [Verrucomicrobiae bacterium]
STQPTLPPPPARRLAQTPGEAIQLAQARPPTPGFVLDWVIEVVSQTDYTFVGSETYLVSGSVNLAGTTTLEGGTVVKYAKNAGAQLTLAALNCQTAPGRPAIFTAADDNTVGFDIGGSTGAPAGDYADTALRFWSDTPPVTWGLTNFRIAYAQQAIHASAAAFSLFLEHGQIVHCSNGVRLPGQGQTVLKNVLLGDVHYGLNDLLYANIAAQHVTFAGPADSPRFLASVRPGYGPTVLLNLKNSVLAKLDAFVVGDSPSLSGEYNGFYQTPTPFGSPAFTPPGGVNPFVNGGAGDYYLAANSGFQNQGGATLSSGLAEALRQRTTAPPTSLGPDTWTTEQTFCRRAIRDDDNALDLGYHYEALDYLFHDLQTTKTVRLEGGVAVGVRGSTTGWGLKLLAGGNLDCVGAPCAMNRIVSFQNVQESPPPIPTTGYFARPGNLWISHTSGTDASCRMVFRFTDFAVGQGCGATVVSVANAAPFAELRFQDCRVRGGLVSVIPAQVNGPRTIRWVNNVWERATLRVFYYAGSNPSPYNQYPVTVECRNNLFRNAYLPLVYQANNGTPGVWEVRDNLFDQSVNVATTDAQGAARLLRSNNGFTAGTANGLGGTENKTGLDRDYQPGPLGDYYYPVNEPLGFPNSLARLR